MNNRTLLSHEEADKHKRDMIEFLYAALLESGGEITVSAANREIAKEKMRVPGGIELEYSTDGLSLRIQ